MARLPYATVAPETQELAASIKRERGGKLLNLYRMLLHSPPVADGWRHLFTALRQQASLPGRARELAILRVAVINGADYEFNAHVPFALKEGVTQAQVDALRAGRDPDGLTESDVAVIAYTQAMTRDIRVPEEVFQRVRACFGEREVVELTATVAGYNLVSRFLVALAIDHE